MMDRRFHQHQSSGERSRFGGGFPRRPIDRARTQENGHLRNRTSHSRIDPDSISFHRGSMEIHSVSLDSQKNSSKRTCGAPIRVLLHEEMSKEKKASESSPSVIAKLMGLDSLPSPYTGPKQQKKPACSNTSYGYKNHSHGIRIDEPQKFKDVFEIKDEIKVGRQTNQSVFKWDSSPKREDTDVSYVRQKFMEAKRLSTDETLQNSKEFNEALEVLDSNKDLFLKFLEEPDSLFSKGVHDLKSFPPAPREKHITVLKSLKAKTYDTGVSSCNLEIKMRSCTQIQKNAISALGKPNTDRFNHLLKEHNGSLSHKLLKSRHAGKTSTSVHSTRIVVLKPNLEKVQGTSRNIPPPGSHEQHMFDTSEVTRKKIKGSREIAREITKQMKCSRSSGSEKMLASGFSRHIKDERSCGLPGACNSNSGTYLPSQDNFDYWSRASSPSSSSSTESAMSREARKRLSERWMMTNRPQETRSVSSGPSTLGDMLAITDRKILSNIRDTVAERKDSDDELARVILETQFNPLSIISRDVQKDETSMSLSRCSSLQSSLGAQGGPKSTRQRVSDGDNCYMLKDVLNLAMDDCPQGNMNQRRTPRKSFKNRTCKPHLNPGGEENKLPVRESHMNGKELQNGTHVSCPCDVKPMLSKLSDVHSSNLANSSLVMELLEANIPSMTREAHAEQPLKEEFSEINHINEVILETSPDHPVVDSVPPHCGGIVSESLTSSITAEQPSPVSVLEHPSEEGESSPECFERVSAGLQDLQMQLQLLRSESNIYDTDCETPVLSENGNEDCNPSPQTGEILQTCRNEEDRDYLYFLDILDGLGINHDSGLSSDDCSLKPPVVSSVFEKLEEKYGVLVDWSKSERKLFFDLISSLLAEILSSSSDRQPWVKPNRRLCPDWECEGLAEKAWSMVVRQQRELDIGNIEKKILDPQWLDLGDDLHTVGKEIEVMLKDELLEEVICEFILD